MSFFIQILRNLAKFLALCAEIWGEGMYLLGVFFIFWVLSFLVGGGIPLSFELLALRKTSATYYYQTLVSLDAVPSTMVLFSSNSFQLKKCPKKFNDLIFVTSYLSSGFTFFQPRDPETIENK